MVDESDGPPEGTNATVEPLLEDEELDNVVSEFRVASREANSVIREEEAVHTLVTWRHGKTVRQHGWTEISVHTRHRQVCQVWSSSRKGRGVSGARVWDISAESVRVT